MSIQSQENSFTKENNTVNTTENDSDRSQSRQPRRLLPLMSDQDKAEDAAAAGAGAPSTPTGAHVKSNKIMPSTVPPPEGVKESESSGPSGVTIASSPGKPLAGSSNAALAEGWHMIHGFNFQFSISRKGGALVITCTGDELPGQVSPSRQTLATEEAAPRKRRPSATEDVPQAVVKLTMYPPNYLMMCLDTVSEVNGEYEQAIIDVQEWCLSMVQFTDHEHLSCKPEASLPSSERARSTKGSVHNIDALPTRKASRIQAMVTRKKSVPATGGPVSSTSVGLRAFLATKRMQAHTKTYKHRNMVRMFHLRSLPDVHAHQQKTTFLDNAFVEDSWLFRPMGHMVQYWRMLVIAVCWFYAWVLPFQLSFTGEFSDPTNADSGYHNVGYHNIGYLLDLIFIMDVFVHLNMAVPKKYLARELENEHDDDDDFLISDRKVIWARYLRGWFGVHLLAALPWYYVLQLFGEQWGGGGGSSGWVFKMQALKLFKMLCVPQLQTHTAVLFHSVTRRHAPDFSRWLRYSKHANFLRLANLLLAIVLGIHYMACIWHAISETRALHPGEDASDSVTVYIEAFRTTLLLILGEDQTESLNNSERVFTILCAFTGALTTAVIFGEVSDLISNYKRETHRHQQKMENVFSMMRQMRLPTALKDRIEGYYNFLWSQYHSLNGLDSSQFMAELSSNLGNEVQLHMRSDLIRRNQLFQKCNWIVILDVVKCLKDKFYLEDDFITAQGVIQREMFFILAGICEVRINVNNIADLITGQDKLPDKVLKSGQSFGELSLVLDVPRKATVVARTTCHLCVLSQKDFIRLAADHDQLEQAMEDEMEKIAKDNGGSDEDGKRRGSLFVQLEAHRQAKGITSLSASAGGGGGAAGAGVRWGGGSARRGSATNQLEAEQISKTFSKREPVPHD
jgi:CRP-like cAMP-binding protein